MLISTFVSDLILMIALGGNRVDDEIRLAGEPSCLSATGCGTARNWNIFHSLVLRVRGYQH